MGEVGPLMIILKKHILIAIIIVATVLIYNILIINCPIKFLLGVSCPTCGMTRSFLSLLKLDIKGSLAYNPMTAFMILAIWLGLHKKLFKNKKNIDMIVIIIAVFTLAVYLIRIFAFNLT